MPYYCSICKKTISEEVYSASMNQFDKALCSDHQKRVTPQALKLYKALREKGVNPILEKNDGFKHVDIAIEWAKLYIEIDGSHHLFSPQQVIADYKRDTYSLKDEFYTKRFSNTSIDEDVRSVAECISDLASLRYREISNNQKSITPDGSSKTVVENPPKKYRTNKKATLIFASVILILCISMVALSVIMSNRIETLQTTNNSLENQLSSLQNNLDNLQSQYDQLNSEYQLLQSGDISSLTSQITDLENQISSLQSQLVDANDIIAQLRGQTGILPTYMDLGWVGPDLNNGNYFLQLSLKNTGDVPINEIFVTLNSVQFAMIFTYLNTTVNAATPLPSYETATGIQDATPPVLHPETYPLLVQAIAANGTTYNYQTTITAHT
jgi:very-short-patch-repair endonuclease/chaperonin cofactor prefoldin